MLNGSEIVPLTIFWDEKHNGCKLEDIDPSINGSKEYYWRCFNCGRVYPATIRRVIQNFENIRIPVMNNYCNTCKLHFAKPKFNKDDYMLWLPEDYKKEIFSIIHSFDDRDSLTTVFVVRCPDCGKWHATTLNTLVRQRDSFCCKSCFMRRKALLANGSIADRLPEILPYYRDTNEFPAEKTPIWKEKIDANKIDLICPLCGKEHSKRLDAVIKNGAYCCHCTKKVNTSYESSLKCKYPEVAEMLDKTTNPLPSHKISYGSGESYNFYCSGEEKGYKPHIFTANLQNVIKAKKKGNIGCPVCAGFKIVAGINDFKSTNPEIAKLWDYEKNDCLPEEVSYNSERNFWFICSKGHSYQANPCHLRRSQAVGYEGCPVCKGKQVVKGINDLATMRPDVVEYWDFEKNEGVISPDEITVYSNKEAWFKCINPDCNKSFKLPIDQRSMTVGFCEECRKHSWSVSEKRLVNDIRGMGVTVEENLHLTGGQYTYDIYMPDYNLAIEYNGLYWHSDRIRPDRNYHYNKYMLCKEKGIDLIYIWEDDYLSKKDLILNFIRRKLGLSIERKINARDCKIIEVSYKEAESFLEKYHIQGGTSGTAYYSLVTKDTNELVAVSVIQDLGDCSLLLKRYATSCMVRGGFSKLLNFVEGFGFNGIYTFSDNGVSSGKLYSDTGFEVISEINPDYKYIYNNKREHKFNFRLERFKKDGNLIYQEGLSESELATLNKIPRVYDAGKIKWYKQF